MSYLPPKWLVPADVKWIEVKWVTGYQAIRSHEGAVFAKDINVINLTRFKRKIHGGNITRCVLRRIAKIERLYLPLIAA